MGLREGIFCRLRCRGVFRSAEKRNAFGGRVIDNLRELINKVCDDVDEYIITTKDDKSAILISYEEYSSMKETIYLLSSKNNRDRLNNAVEQIENSKFLKKEIDL